MLENMSGFVGQAAHIERQRQAHERIRFAETTGRRPAAGIGTATRTAIATRLVAHATRIAPAVATPSPGIRTLVP